MYCHMATCQPSSESRVYAARGQVQTLGSVTACSLRALSLDVLYLWTGDGAEVQLSTPRVILASMLVLQRLTPGLLPLDRHH